MVEIEKLSKRFGRKVAVEELDLTVQPGEILGFLGPNGAGKSTTVKILTGMLKPSSGSARICGHNVVEDSLEAKRKIGFVPESGAVYEVTTPNEYLDLIATLHDIDRDRAQTRSKELLRLFGLSDQSGQQMFDFSKGMKQKVLLCAALVTEPEVLLLDEPLNGLDANTVSVVKELLRSLANDGRTILFCSHILEVVERLCTRIVIIDHGRTITQGTSEEIREKENASTLEEAFSRITGISDPASVSSDIMSALK
ncbi:MAG: ABC transporter ATP-binding protein [Gammaproteobacteria bacterium]|nr:ABC transporter ATP-binding protein [Gammaproteobacteria bacterium]